MLGDLVQGHLPNTPSKVVGIPNEYRIAVITPGGAYMELSIDDFLPILITQEILEKNFPNPMPVCWYPDRDTFRLIIFTGDNGDVAFNFTFVHELQNALRLLKIEKEIVL